MANIKFNAKHGVSVGTAAVPVIDNLGNVTATSILTNGTSTLTGITATTLNTTGAVTFTAVAPTSSAAILANDNSTKLATTAHVRNQLSSTAPLIDGVADSGVGILGSREDHVHPVDTTRAPIVNASLTGTTAVQALSVSGNASLATLTLTGAVTGSVNVTTGNDFKINGVSMLNSTALGTSIVGSSLTSVGTITSGVWNGTLLDVSHGGTGGANPTDALNGLLPAGRTIGYVLKTGGGSTFYWAAEVGGGGTQGTAINTARLSYTATAAQVLFATPTYTIGTGQLRVYVNGVRQYGSEYTETSTTSVTFNVPGCAAGDLVLIEVDAYTNVQLTADAVNYTAIGSLPGGTVQNGLAALDSGKATVAQTMYLGTTAVPINRVSGTGHILNGLSLDGVTHAALATGFTVSGGTTSKTLTVNNSVGLSGTDGSTLNIGAGGTLGTAAFATIGNYALLASPAFTTQISVGASVIKPSASSYGAITVDGLTNTWNGINFKTGATNIGTFMAQAGYYHGWENAANTAWAWYCTDNGTMTVATSVTAYNFYGTFNGTVNGTITSSFTSTQITPITSGVITVAHGLGAAPSFIIAQLVCLTAQYGYVAGDVIADVGHSTPASWVTVSSNATNIYLSTISGIYIGDRTNGTTANLITSANWRLVFKAYK